VNIIINSIHTRAAQISWATVTTNSTARVRANKLVRRGLEGSIKLSIG